MGRNCSFWYYELGESIEQIIRTYNFDRSQQQFRESEQVSLLLRKQYHQWSKVSHPTFLKQIWDLFYHLSWTRPALELSGKTNFDYNNKNEGNKREEF